MTSLRVIAVVVIACIATSACERSDAGGSAASAVKPATTQESLATLPASMTMTEAKTAQGDAVSLRYVAIGDIALPSGRVIACDGIVLEPGEAGFATALPQGKHPVILTIARFASNGDERVACATIRFSKSDDAQRLKWEPALRPGEDPATLEADSFFGYGVDSGTGCFVDPVGMKAIEAIMDKDHAFFQTIITEMAKNRHTSWDWTNLVVDPASGANLVVFSAGVGDGAYPCYFGRDAAGNVACLVTDFLLLDEKTLPWAEAQGKK